MLIYSPRGECPSFLLVLLAALGRKSRKCEEVETLTKEHTDESDLRVVCKIIEAAIWYTVEERVDLVSLLATQ